MDPRMMSTGTSRHVADPSNPSLPAPVANPYFQASAFELDSFPPQPPQYSPIPRSHEEPQFSTTTTEFEDFSLNVADSDYTPNADWFPVDPELEKWVHEKPSAGQNLGQDNVAVDDGQLEGHFASLHDVSAGQVQNYSPVYAMNPEHNDHLQVEAEQGNIGFPNGGDYRHPHAYEDHRFGVTKYANDAPPVKKSKAKKRMTMAAPKVTKEYNANGDYIDTRTVDVSYEDIAKLTPLTQVLPSGVVIKLRTPDNKVAEYDLNQIRQQGIKGKHFFRCPIDSCHMIFGRRHVVFRHFMGEKGSQGAHPLDKAAGIDPWSHPTTASYPRNGQNQSKKTSDQTPQAGAQAFSWPAEDNMAGQEIHSTRKRARDDDEDEVAAEDQAAPNKKSRWTPSQQVNIEPQWAQRQGQNATHTNVPSRSPEQTPADLKATFDEFIKLAGHFQIATGRAHARGLTTAQIQKYMLFALRQ